jgi:GNAT superfamily N-acetyltransferase
MTIRTATPSDAGDIVSMLARLAAETGDAARFSSTPEVILTYGFGPDALFHALIAEQNGAPVGLVLFFRHFSTTRGAPGVYVQDLWTAPEVRGHGHGAALLAAVAARAWNGWGARYLALTIHGHNVAAHAFYERLGFEAHAGDVPMLLGGDGFAALGKGAEAAA